MTYATGREWVIKHLGSKVLEPYDADVDIIACPICYRVYDLNDEDDDKEQLVEDITAGKYCCDMCEADNAPLNREAE